ncbi:hypothetical protein PI125_g23955 [Phytophthora idaei]|nr:hypothetical protein PI125_g23955 [Phytophthora idaei]
MQLHHVLLVAAILGQGLSASKTTPKTSKWNGWYPCSEYNFSGTGSSDVQAAECATYSAPLCYPGVCEAPEWTRPLTSLSSDYHPLIPRLLQYVASAGKPRFCVQRS